MPTYAYACDSCGLAKDEWLKVSEAQAVLTCPSCGKASYRKQLTAPAFQLKGSGWYVTDFRNKESASKSPSKPESEGSSAKAETAASSNLSSKTTETSSATPASATSTASTPNPSTPNAAAAKP